MSEEDRNRTKQLRTFSKRKDDFYQLNFRDHNHCYALRQPFPGEGRAEPVLRQPLYPVCGFRHFFSSGQSEQKLARLLTAHGEQYNSTSVWTSIGCAVAPSSQECMLYVATLESQPMLSLTVKVKNESQIAALFVVANGGGCRYRSHFTSRHTTFANA